MAIYVPGMKCPLCRRPITQEQTRRLSPPFVKDTLDPLYVFHDATVHEDCYLRDSRMHAVEEAVAVASSKEKTSAE